MITYSVIFHFLSPVTVSLQNEIFFFKKMGPAPPWALEIMSSSYPKTAGWTFLVSWGGPGRVVCGKLLIFLGESKSALLMSKALIR